MKIFEVLFMLFQNQNENPHTFLGTILGWAGGLLFMFINVADWVFGITAVVKILGLITSIVFSYYAALIKREEYKTKKEEKLKKQNESNEKL